MLPVQFSRSQSCRKAYDRRVEFLNLTKYKFEWENDDIPTGEMTGEEEPIYPILIAEIRRAYLFKNKIAEFPGVELETDFRDIENIVEETSAPSLEDWAAAAMQNANLLKTTGVDSKSIGVHRPPDKFSLKYKVEDVSDNDVLPPKMVVNYDSYDSNISEDKSDDPPPCVKSNDGGDDANNTVLVEAILEDDEDDSDVTPGPHREGVTTRKPQIPYQTSFRGKTYPGSLFLQVPVHHHKADFTTNG